tara:strand:+ start:299 stop:1054 length:756 start_codon:yes stop_codon:yes gene_type:complete
LKVKFYIRYVDDFVILHSKKEKLRNLKSQINDFLKEKLDITLHQNKSYILGLEKGVNFLGFKIFYYHKILRKSNRNNFERELNTLKFLYKEDIISREKAVMSLEGWLAYAAHANTFKYRKYILKTFNKHFTIDKSKIAKIKKYRNFTRKIKESQLRFSSQKTLFLFNKGLTIEEISKKRSIKESTVYNHLANLIEHNQLSITNILSKSKIIKIINKIYNKKDKLKDIRKRLGDSSITYDEINCVLASLRPI